MSKNLNHSNQSGSLLACELTRSLGYWHHGMRKNKTGLYKS